MRSGVLLWGAYSPGRSWHMNFTHNETSPGLGVVRYPPYTMTTLMSAPLFYPGGNAYVNTTGADIYFFAGSAQTQKDGFSIPNAACNTYGPLFGSCYPGTNQGSMTADDIARGSNYGDLVDVARTWQAASPAPISSGYIETYEALMANYGAPTPNGAGTRIITPPEYNWANWSSIIHGARTLADFGTTGGYFGNSLQATFGLDAALQKGVTAASVHTGGGGSGYAVNDPVTLYNGVILKVTSVSSGAITGVSILWPGAVGYESLEPGYPSSPSSSAVPALASYLTAGTGATFDLTWTTNQTVSMQTQATATHALIEAMAPVINSPFALGFTTVSTPDSAVGYNFNGASLAPSGSNAPASALPRSGIEIMTKYYNSHEGSSYTNPASGGPTTFLNGYYIFADTRYGEVTGPFPVTATFTIPAGFSTATVVGESRSISISGTTFTDTFAKATDVHIYMIQ